MLSVKEIWRRVKHHPLSRLGPGLITGVADDDPSGIVTYSQAGAQFGLNMLWTMPFAYPLMSAVQALCARIGRVTGRGLADNIRRSFHPAILFFVVFLLVCANILNIAADVAAVGEVAELVIGLNRHLMSAGFVLASLALQIFVPYHRYVFFLKWLTLSLLAYAAVLFTVHVPWGEVFLRTVWPHIGIDSNTAAVVVAIFGTTISPYLFFWQASEEVEDMNATAGAEPLFNNDRDALTELKRINWDTWSGMLYSNVTSYFIILATALTLHAAGITDITTAAQAASALRPLAGEFAFILFAIGILGVGLIGVPVLAGSAAYAFAEMMGWKWGLERSVKQAKGFYSILAFSVLIALAIQYSLISPMKALFWSAVINGVVAVPLLIVIMLLASKTSVMGQYVATPSLRILGWLTTAVMGFAAVWLFVPS